MKVGLRNMSTEKTLQEDENSHRSDGVQGGELVRALGEVNLDEVHMGVVLRKGLKDRLDRLARRAPTRSEIYDLKTNMSLELDELRAQILTVSLLASVVNSLSCAVVEISATIMRVDEVWDVREIGECCGCGRWVYMWAMLDGISKLLRDVLGKHDISRSCEDYMHVTGDHRVSSHLQLLSLLPSTPAVFNPPLYKSPLSS